MTNPLLRIEGETLSYAELSAQFGVSERTMRAAVRKARGLKAGLTRRVLKRVIADAFKRNDTDEISSAPEASSK